MKSKCSFQDGAVLTCQVPHTLLKPMRTKKTAVTMLLAFVSVLAAAERQTNAQTETIPSTGSEFTPEHFTQSGRRNH